METNQCEKGCAEGEREEEKSSVQPGQLRTEVCSKRTVLQWGQCLGRSCRESMRLTTLGVGAQLLCPGVAASCLSGEKEARETGFFPSSLSVWSMRADNLNRAGAGNQLRELWNHAGKI